MRRWPVLGLWMVDVDDNQKPDLSARGQGTESTQKMTGVGFGSDLLILCRIVRNGKAPPSQGDILILCKLV